MTELDDDAFDPSSAGGDLPPQLERRGALAYMAGNPVASNLLMLLLLVGGFIMMSNVRQEVFPETRIDVVNIAVPYPGASPSEVEQGVVLAVEEALLGIEGVDRITATASEGAALVSVELMDGVEPYSVTAEVQAAVDRITSLPQDVERPTVSLASHVTETASVIFYGDVPERTLRDLAQRARDDLLSDSRITDVKVTEIRPVEVSIEIPQENLRRYGLTHQQVAAVISASSVELPAGAIDAESGEILLRTAQRRQLGPEFADIVLLATPDGTKVRLGDVATVIDGFQDTDQQALFNGLPASRVRVFRAGSQTPIELSDAIYAYLDGPGSRLPPGVEAEVWFDRSEMYRDRINLLLKNAYIGLILVLIILGAFLQIKLAFWVTLGIPISFLGAVLFMPSLDVSFNMISLFAFILSLGIVVDDAIVVGEAIHHRQKTGLRGVDAAIAGVRDVAIPVTFSVLTTIIAFTPLLFIPGVTGRFVRNIPLIVISVFLISLIESLFILPAHLAHSHEKPMGGLLGATQRAQAAFSRGFDRFIEHFFRPSLQPALRARYLTLAIALAGVILSIGLVAAGKVKFTYMPRVESDVVSASLRMPFGTPVERTREVVDRMIAELGVVLEKHGGQDITRGIYASIGSGAESFGPGGGGSGGSHVANVSLNMVPIDDRSVTAGEVAREWRERIGEVAGAEVLSFNFSTGPSAGAPISVRLSHSDIETLENAAEGLAEHLGTYEGVIDIDSGVSYGKEQLDLELSPTGRAAGLTESDLARQVRSAFFGAEAARQQRGRDELRVYVRLPESERQSEHFIESMIVRTPDGSEMPLERAAEIHRGRAYTSISRVNGRRVITVTADVVDGVANAGEVSTNLADEVLPSLLNDVPGLTFDFAGEREDQQKSMAAMKTGLALSLLGMFTLMAVAFRSYLQPLIIMSAIPFGIVGAMLGHILMGYSVSMLSVFGMVALSGVVVNDSLLLVTTINEYRSNGMTTFDAVVTGAVRRFRPILMTSLTTFFGLAPMILETSVQARFLIPMAISLGFGILFVTIITLALVPCLYLVIEDVVRATRWALRSGGTER